MFPNLTTDEVMELAAKVGKRVAREYPGIEADDIASEALRQLVDKAESLNCDDEPYIYKVLYNDGVRYAAKERYDYMISTSKYVYQPKEVRALLEEAYWVPSMWDVPSAKDDWMTATVSGATVGVSLIDIQEAWKNLKPDHADTLLRKFRDDLEVADRKSVTRAVDALTRFMNYRANRPTDHEGPGAREAMSNAAAQFVTASEGGHEAASFNADSLDRVQGLRVKEPSAPAGTYYDWGKAIA
jgi:hypothetical protein